MANQKGLPLMLGEARKSAFAWLVLIALAEVGAQVGATAALKTVLLGYSGGKTAAAWLLATGLLAALLAWQRAVRSEAFGQSYVHALRCALGQQAIAVTAGTGQGRFGTLAIRMSSDLQAMKNWADRGICGGLTGLLGIVGGLVSLHLAARWAGLVSGLAVTVATLLVIAGSYSLLAERVRQHRRERGRVSTCVGDLLLGAPADATYAAEARALRPISRASMRLKEAAVKEASAAGLLRLPALMAVPAGFALSLLLLPAEVASQPGGHSWATLLLALGILAVGLSHLTLSVAAHAEWQAADERLRGLTRQAKDVAPVTPGGRVRLPPGAGLTLQVDGEVLVESGAYASLSRDAIADSLTAIVHGAHNVTVDTLRATSIYPVDWPRRVAYAGSLRPLRRGTLTRVLAAKRNAGAEAMRSALSLAGLSPQLVDDNPVIDPTLYGSDPVFLARLRLARALAHRPRILIIDDPWLSVSDDVLGRVRDWCAAQSVSLLVLQPD